MRKIILVSLFAVIMLSLACAVAIAGEESLAIAGASASSVYYNPSTYGADKTIDGDDNTSWIGARDASPWWITFDMGEVEDVSKISIKWLYASYIPANYNIQVSSDGSIWEDVYIGISGVYNSTGDIKEINRKARYVRLYIISVVSSFPGIKELTAYTMITVPHAIRFQGTLGDANGVPLEGAFALTFRLYDADTGGLPLWEEAQSPVNIVKGALDVELGSVTPINLAFTKQYWLGVEVGSDGEMSPRFKLTSVPYAFASEK